jgi:hypothetical protein
MSCEIRSEEHTEQLLAYAAGRLRGAAASRLELHMRSCEECAATGKSQSEVWNLLDNWEVRPVSLDFNRRLYARIDAAASESWLERLRSAVGEFLHPVFSRPALPIAAASLLIVAGFVLDHPGRSFSPVSIQTAEHRADVNKVDLEVDQVEATLEDIEMLRQFDSKLDDGGTRLLRSRCNHAQAILTGGCRAAGFNSLGR